MFDIFGFAMTNEMLFFLFIIAIGVLMLGFSKNKKYNLDTLQALSKELEAALQPEDQTYTWIGGSVGFKAEYLTPAPLRKVEATMTMLARQSLLFYPISKLLFGNDRLFVVAHPHANVRREAHILERWYYKLRLRKLDRADAMKQQTLTLNGTTFYLFAHNQTGLQALTAWLRACPAPGLIRHVAVMPESHTLYLYMVPRRGAVEAVVNTLPVLLDNKPSA